MITSIIRYILFVQYILLNFQSFTISVKTYQVQRINQTSYLVTSFPDSEFETFYSKGYEPKAPIDKMVFLNPVKDSLNIIATGGLGDLKVGKPNTKLPASYINKARDNYFKYYFTETKKTMATKPGLPPLLNQDPAYLNYEYKWNLEYNLLKARNLASVLISESQYQDVEGKAKYKPTIRKKDVMQRPRRRYVWKTIRSPYN